MDILDLLSSAAILIFSSIIIACLWAERHARIAPVPVLPHVRARALAMALRHTSPTQSYKIADLGCGWGGLLMALSRQYPKASVTGYEISFCPFWASKLRSHFNKKISICNSDFMQDDLSSYDILFCYLSPRHMDALKPKLSTLKPGSIIISCSFPIPGWEVKEQEIVRSVVKIPVFVYLR